MSQAPTLSVEHKTSVILTQANTCTKCTHSLQCLKFLFAMQEGEIFFPDGNYKIPYLTGIPEGKETLGRFDYDNKEYFKKFKLCSVIIMLNES